MAGGLPKSGPQRLRPRLVIGPPAERLKAKRSVGWRSGTRRPPDDVGGEGEWEGFRERPAAHSESPPRVPACFPDYGWNKEAGASRLRPRPTHTNG